MKDDITVEELSELLKDIFQGNLGNFDTVPARLAHALALSQNDVDGQASAVVVSLDGDTSNRASIVLVSQNNSDGDTSSHTSIVVVSQNGSDVSAELAPVVATLLDDGVDVQVSLSDHLTPRVLDIDSIFG